MALNLNKQLRVTFTLTSSNAVFPGTSANVLQLTGLRMSCHIEAAGAAMSTQVSMQIYGMSQADMNALSVASATFGIPGYLNNTVLVETNTGNGWTAVFAGSIIQAGADYSAMPEVFLQVQAQTGFYDQIAAAQPTSFPGPSYDVATVASAIVAKMGTAAFVNNGVNVQLPGAAYYSGSLQNQLETLCAAANIVQVREGQSGGASTITITPWGVPRTATASIILSPQNGLVGYPKVRGDGFIEVRALYNPGFILMGGLTISGSDSVVGNNVPTTYNSLANGQWTIAVMKHALEAVKPNGAWFTDMVLYPATVAVPAAA